MNSTMKPVVSTFSEIKKRLDPRYSFVIFEREEVCGRGPPFREILPELGQLGKGVLERATYREEAGKRLFLVLKLEPSESDRIIEKILMIKLPEDISCSVYGVRGNGELAKE